MSVVHANAYPSRFELKSNTLILVVDLCTCILITEGRKWILIGYRLTNSLLLISSFQRLESLEGLKLFRESLKSHRSNCYLAHCSVVYVIATKHLCGHRLRGKRTDGYFLGLVNTKIVNNCAGSQCYNRGEFFPQVPFSRLLGCRSDCLLF